jgi:hypothetical protein
MLLPVKDSESLKGSSYFTDMASSHHIQLFFFFFDPVNTEQGFPN